MIKKHGPHYWLDIRVNGRRIRRSLKTGERALAIERARDISREIQKEYARKDIRISEFSAKYLEWAWKSVGHLLEHGPPGSEADDEQETIHTN